MLRKHKVLLVDDQQVDRTALARLLEGEYRILTACNGREALQLLDEQGESVSAVLLDLAMPVMDGWAVLRAMQADRQTDWPPVLVTTQQGDDETQLAALELGAADFLAKPCNVSILRCRLRNLIRMHLAAEARPFEQSDALTGLPTESAFIDRAMGLLAEQTDTVYELAALGVERLGLISAQFGAAQVNRLLQYTAFELQRLTDGAGGLCARLGKNFLVLTPEDHPPRWLTEQLNEQLKGFPLGCRLCVKAGAYRIQERTVNLADACEAALAALKKAQQSLDETVCRYDDGVRSRHLHQQRLMADLSAALKDGQLQVYYQPKCRTMDGLVLGAEALVRWDHPALGVMQPGEFMPLFEDTGLITEVDCMVWTQVCRQLAQWKREGRAVVPASINLSRKDLSWPGLCDFLEQLLTENGLDHREVRLEITESACIEDTDQMLTVLDQLRGLGFSIEMDDFGSGHSTLNMLAEVQVDTVKLDIGFIHNLCRVQNGKTVVRAVIAMAHSLRMSVVAEGVEERDQWEALRRMGCDLVQGDFCAPAMPAEKFAALLKPGMYMIGPAAAQNE